MHPGGRTVKMKTVVQCKSLRVNDVGSVPLLMRFDEIANSLLLRDLTF